ncbi:hypothetical protein yc1106_01876 [Curvularia clavata]|uniref:Uncharacterized protein n=1 Tax=Curvularia clavata TaxID=95742 RepID=A0A9Q9DPJ5_CURCL|nr:hypothetical protein yc1106_01876 [Curvularia clavata]
MASASFRESMNSLGWSRRESQAPVSTAPPSLLDRIQNLNPFAEGGYVRLPTTETNPGAPLPAPSRREEEEGWFALSRWDRLLVFGGLLLAALAMFATCIGLMFTPVFLVRPRKFAIFHCNIGTGPLCSDHAGPRFGALQGTDSLHRVKSICQALMHVT